MSRSLRIAAHLEDGRLALVVGLGRLSRHRRELVVGRDGEADLPRSDGAGVKAGSILSARLFSGATLSALITEAQPAMTATASCLSAE